MELSQVTTFYAIYYSKIFDKQTMICSGKQELSVQNVVSMVQSGGGEALLQHAEQRGLDPALLNGVMGIIRWGRV